MVSQSSSGRASSTASPQESPTVDQSAEPVSQSEPSQRILHSAWFQNLGIGLSAATFFSGAMRAVATTVDLQPHEQTETVILYQPRLALETRELRERPILATSFDSVRVEAPSGPASEATAKEIQELKTYAAKRDALIERDVQRWEHGATSVWNSIARDLVKELNLNPPQASRAYALLSVAQHDALIATYQAQAEFTRPAPSRVDPTLTTLVPAVASTYPSDHAALASAARTILSYVFPQKAEFLEQQAQNHIQSRLYAGVNYRSDVTEGERIGRSVALRVIEYAAQDGSVSASEVKIPSGEGYWRSSMTPPKPALLPSWGETKTWNIERGSQFRPEPPPAFGSSAFKEALAEVRKISDTRTEEQLRIAKFWADGPGTVTPPGHWNEIAAGLVKKYALTEMQASRVYAALNTTMEDAGIACWDSKYAYWYIRPSQVDSAITTPVGLPNFPSYVSGHSTFSGAAAEVLSYFFPAEASGLRNQAQEASLSRVYGGIHYRFDAEQGIALGKKVGEVTVAKLKAASIAPIRENQKELIEWFNGVAEAVAPK